MAGSVKFVTRRLGFQKNWATPANESQASLEVTVATLRQWSPSASPAAHAPSRWPPQRRAGEPLASMPEAEGATAAPLARRAAQPL